MKEHFASDSEKLLAYDKEHLWHPYTCVTDPLPVYHVVGASGVRLELADGSSLVDGMSSWWCAVHGYSHPVLVEALRRQAGIMSHVMFGGLTHGPAVELGRRLLSVCPAGLNRVFFSDSGSVAVEVALKMAYQYWLSRGQKRHLILSVSGGYHGDTFAAMSVTDPVGGMHGFFSGILMKQLFAPRPEPAFSKPWSESYISELNEILFRHKHELAAVILEPVVQGAGGMRFFSPFYLERLRKLCDEADVLLIADEIATGFGRSGKFFACEHAGISPDILCLGKSLTGGMMSLAATVATDKIAYGIGHGEQPVLMHGPTFMANPLACSVAVASLDLLADGLWQEQVNRIEAQLKSELSACLSLPFVSDVRVLGAIGVVETTRPVDMARLQEFFVKSGVWIRPFGRLVYLMPPYVIDKEDLTLLTTALYNGVSQGGMFL